MKALAFVLCILISALVITPCSDDITCTEVNQYEHTHEASSAHNHSDDESDLCSPFCTCACCGYYSVIIYSMPSFYVERIDAAMTPHQFTLYKSNFSSSYFYSFWQPPKLALS